MRVSRIALVAVLGWTVTAQADENVMLDLSVLDSLTPSYAVSNEPLFPVLPKKEKKQAHFPVVTKSETSKKQTVKVVKTEPVKSNSVAKSSEKIKPIEKIQNVVEAEPVVVVDVEPVEVVDVEPAAPVKVVDVEPIAPAKAIDVEPVVPAKVEAVKTEPLPGKKQVEVNPQQSQKTEPGNRNITDSQSSNDAKTSLESQTVKSQEVLPEVKEPSLVSTEPVSANKNAEAPLPSLLIEEPAVEVADDERSIVFAPDVDELSSEQMAKIDNIIGRFKDLNSNKIAIYAYNLDDGVDSFRKKRISLNRAVEVRSYLLKQGYKNFSIKVVNINSDSDKVNTVELEEI